MVVVPPVLAVGHAGVRPAAHHRQGPGDHSQALAKLQPGTRVFAEGPYGAFTPALSRPRVLLIAGGVGITPIRAMFAALPSERTASLVYRASHPRDVVFSASLTRSRRGRSAVHYLVGSRAEIGGDPLPPCTADPGPRA